MNGSRTPDDIRDKFKAKFLQTGNVATAAKFAKLPYNTGWCLAQELEEDPKFREARDRLRANVLPRAEAMLIRSLQVAAKRSEKKPRTITHEHGATHIDTAPQYGRNLVDGYRALAQSAKIAHDMKPGNKPTWPSGIRITIDGAEPDAPAGEEPCPKS